MTDYARSWSVRKRRCSLTCRKPRRSFTRRYGRIRRLPTQVGHTTVPRKLCSMNCASVLASCGSQVRCNSSQTSETCHPNQLSSDAILTESNKEIDRNSPPLPPCSMQVVVDDLNKAKN